MPIPERDSYADRRAGAHRAVHADRSAMELDEFLDQREADAGAFVRPALCSVDAMEALEDMREFVCRDAGPRVAHHHRRVRSLPLDADGDFAIEGEFECVRDQVEDDLLPHLPVDV